MSKRDRLNSIGGSLDSKVDSIEVSVVKSWDKWYGRLDLVFDQYGNLFLRLVEWSGLMHSVWIKKGDMDMEDCGLSESVIRSNEIKLLNLIGVAG